MSTSKPQTCGNPPNHLHHQRHSSEDQQWHHLLKHIQKDQLHPNTSHSEKITDPVSAGGSLRQALSHMDTTAEGEALTAINAQPAEQHHNQQQHLLHPDDDDEFNSSIATPVRNDCSSELQSHGQAASYDQELLEQYIDDQHRRMVLLGQHPGILHSTVNNSAVVTDASHAVAADGIKLAKLSSAHSSLQHGILSHSLLSMHSSGGEVKQRLHALFEAIENEFDRLLAENLVLRERLQQYEQSGADTFELERKDGQQLPLAENDEAETPASKTLSRVASSTTVSVDPPRANSEASSTAGSSRPGTPLRANTSKGTGTSTRKFPNLPQAIFHGTSHSRGDQNKTQKFADRVRQFGNRLKLTRSGIATDRSSGGGGGGGGHGANTSTAQQVTGGDTALDSTADLYSTVPQSNIKRRYLHHPDIVFDVECAEVELDLVEASRQEPYYVFSASADKTVAVWSQSLANPICIYTGHRGAVNAIRVRKATGIACSASGDRTCHLWRLDDLYNDSSSTDVSRLISSASFSHLTEKWSDEDMDDSLQGDYSDEAGSDTASIDSSDEQIHSHGPELPLNQPVISSRRLHVLEGHTSVVSSCGWLSDDRVVTASWDGKIRIFDIEAGGVGSPVKTIDNHDPVHRVVASNLSESIFVSCSIGNTFKMWDVRMEGQLVHKFKGHSDQVSSAAFANNDRFLFSASDDGVLKFWDLRKIGEGSKSSLNAMKSINCHSGINDISVSSYHSRIAVATNKRTVRVFDISGQSIQSFQKDGHRQMVTSVSWSSDGNHVFSASSDRSIIQWNAS